MSDAPFWQVDAFADRPFAGNPAAVLLLEDWPDDAVLQAIAAENNLSETAFLVAKGGDHALRWFTPTMEVAMCGHATLASGHVLLSRDSARDEARFATRKAGTLVVRREGAGYTLDLPSWPAKPKPLPELVVIAGAEPEATLWHDAGYAVLVYRDAAAVRALAPDLPALAAFGFVMLIATAPGHDSDVVSRVFVPGAGVDEDPVTGSAHAVIADYWAGRLGRDRFSAVQASVRGGRMGVRLAGDRVRLSGECVTVIEGRFRFG